MTKFKEVLQEIKWAKVVNTLILALSGFSVAYVAGKEVSWKQLLILVGLLLLILVVYIFQIYFFNNNKNDELQTMIGKYEKELKNQSDRQTKHFENIIGKYENKLALYSDWFYSHERLSNIEKNYCDNKMDSIWVASSNLEYERKNSPFYDAIKDNLNDGISYFYIVPKSKYTKLKVSINDLLNFAKSTEGKITFIPIEDEDLFLFLSNIVIYRDKSTEYPEAFKELQIAKDLEARAWMKINEQNPDFNELYSKFEEHIQQN